MPDHAADPDLARDIDARCRLTGEFTLRSGQVSHEYFDKYLFEAEPQLLRRVVAQMRELVPDGTELLGGLEMGGIPIATMLAYVLYLGVPGGRFFRFAWFAPTLISWIVVGIIFKWLYNYEWGAVNVLLRSVGLTPLATNWLGNVATALPALIAMTTWKQVGFNMVILLAAISSMLMRWRK